MNVGRIIKESVRKSASVNTIQDLLSVHYGGSEIAKADAPLLTSTAGANNDVFGAEVFSQLNESVPAFSILPKKPYRKAGFRVRTARGVTLGSSGVGENGAIPETVLSTYTELSMTLKHHVDSYNDSLLQELRSGVDNDDLSIDQVRRDTGEDHVKSIEKSLLQDADTLAGSNFESIDRIVSSQSEESTFLTAGDADIYGFDRSGSTALDAYVDDNAGTDRVITKDLIRTAIRTITQNSGESPNVILTGYDTLGDIEALYESQARVVYERVTVGVNGVQTAAGNDVGLQVRSIEGIPLIASDQVAQDTISRVYLLNTNHLWMEMALPTRNFESDDYLALDALGTKGMFITAGELKCVKFTAQGKIRDLK